MRPNCQRPHIMIPRHKEFIESISQKKKVRVKFYSQPDSGVLDRVCAPMDYGPGGEIQDGLNRYWLWDYQNNAGPRALGLVPQQIVDLEVMGEGFDPSDFGVQPWAWSIPRVWKT
jgi:hypothetical protein